LQVGHDALGGAGDLGAQGEGLRLAVGGGQVQCEPGRAGGERGPGDAGQPRLEGQPRALQWPFGGKRERGLAQ